MIGEQRTAAISRKGLTVLNERLTKLAACIDKDAMNELLINPNIKTLDVLDNEVSFKALKTALEDCDCKVNMDTLQITQLNTGHANGTLYEPYVKGTLYNDTVVKEDTLDNLGFSNIDILDIYIDMAKQRIKENATARAWYPVNLEKYTKENNQATLTEDQIKALTIQQRIHSFYAAALSIYISFNNKFVEGVVSVAKAINDTRKAGAVGELQKKAW